MSRHIIETSAAPSAIGPYSQAVRVGRTVYLSGQIPLLPHSMELVEGAIEIQARQVFDNLAAVAEACGGSLADIVKLTLYLTDLDNFSRVNEVMENHFQPPYPARAALGVKALPRGAEIEADAILVLSD